jgi:sigma-B regulation protein RsbU (phosphoserine phosphatase)
VTRRIVVVLVLTAILVSLQVRSVQVLLTHGTPPQLPIDVEHGAVVVGSLERGPSAQVLKGAGVRQGDRIVAAYDADGYGGPVTGLARLLDVRRDAAPGKPTRLEVRRPGVDGVLTFDVPPGPSRPMEVLALTLALTILLPSFSLLAALLLGLLKPEDRRAYIGSLLFLSFAGVFGVEPHSLPAGSREIALVVRLVCVFAVDVLFLWFFLIFPTPSLIDRRAGWLKPLALAVMGIGMVLQMLLQMSRLSSLATYEQLRGLLPDTLESRLFDVAGLTFIGIGVLSLTLNTIRPQSRDDRRRMVIILTGTLACLVPLLATITYFSMVNRQPPLWLGVALGSLIGLFPLSFVYAVLRHRVLGIRLMLRRGAQYALISAGFRVLLGVVVFLLFWYVIGPIMMPVGQGPVANGFVAAGAALTAERLLRKVRGRVMPAIDRRFFRDAYDARRVLTSLGHSVRELALEPDRLLTRLVDTVSETLHPRTTAVLMRSVEADGGGGLGDFRCVALRRDEGRPINAASIVVPAAGVVARRIAPTGESSVTGPASTPVDVFVDEPRSWAHALVGDRAHAAERASIEALGVQLVVPFVAGQRLLGMLLLGEKRSEEPYSRDDKDLLGAVAEQTALALDYGQLARRAAREESLRKEVEIARNVQTRLFPQELPEMPALDYAGVCRPAREVGGDSYDFIALGDGRFGLAVGDISGKGVAAALLMANLQALLRSHAPLPGRELKDLVGDINRLLVASIPDNRFATFFYGVFDAPRRSLTYVNAGHNPPMLLRRGAGTATRLDPTGVMLGVFAEATFAQETIAVEPGDLIVAYSDGVCDALNLAGEDYGDSRLESFVRTHAALPASGLMDRILEDVTTFSQGVPPFDDMTLVVARVLEA